MHPVVTASAGHHMPLPLEGTCSPWGSIRFSPMVKGKGCVFDGLSLAPGSLLVSASVEQLGVCEVTVGQNASLHFPGVRTCLQGGTGGRDTQLPKQCGAAVDIPHHPRGAGASVSCPRGDADILPCHQGTRYLALLPKGTQASCPPWDTWPRPEHMVQGNVGRGHPRGRAQPVTWFVNDYLMTLGGPQGGAGPPGCLAPPTHLLDLALCPAPPPGSWPIGPRCGPYKRGVEEWEGSQRPRGHKGN